jgi:hypothetical protein
MTKAVQLVAICRSGCGRQGCGHVLQEVTLPTAELKGATWTDEEIAFIQDTLDEPLSVIALTLNRTYFGTAKARSLIRRGIMKA